MHVLSVEGVEKSECSPSKWQVCYLPAFKIVPNTRLDSGVWRAGERRKGSCFVSSLGR